MEDILASIKRVIAEDGRAGLRAARPARPVPVEPESSSATNDDDVLELDDPVIEADGLISDDAATASRQSLAALAAMRDPASPASAASAPCAADAPLEAVVRDMLRPMLKDWLEQRLPDIVDELVAREIARITGKSA